MNVKLPVAVSAASAGNTRDDRIPPVAVQTRPVPAHAMHSRNPRRFTRSMWSSSSVLFDDDGPLHEIVQGTGVGVHTRDGETVGVLVIEIETSGLEGLRVRRHGVGLLVMVDPPDGGAGSDRELGGGVLRVPDLDRGGRAAPDTRSAGNEERKSHRPGNGHPPEPTAARTSRCLRGPWMIVHAPANVWRARTFRGFERNP